MLTYHIITIGVIVIFIVFAKTVILYKSTLYVLFILQTYRTTSYSQVL